MSWIGVRRDRTRTLGAEWPKVEGVAKFYLGGNPYLIRNLGGTSYTGFERTQDETHPMFFKLRGEFGAQLRKQYGNPFFRILSTGGSFYSRKFYFLGPPSRPVSLATTGGNRQEYQGQVSAIQFELAKAAPDPIDLNRLKNHGAEQLLRNRPDQPIVGISQTLAELKREGLPRVRSLSSFRSYSPRKGGEDYLSWQFGFRPIIQDAYALADSISSANKQWEEYVNRANKLQRRRYDFPVETSTTVEKLALSGSIYPILPGNLATGQNADVYRTRTTVVKRRFSAAYVYTLPRGSESTMASVRKVQQLRSQYGLSVDPALLWELTPWSWLIDWFLPIGDFVESVSSLVLGNSAAPWAYISEHVRVLDTYERPGCSLRNGSSPDPVRVVSDYKRRIKANPLGFTIDWPDLSPKQLSILAAIGITR